MDTIDFAVIALYAAAVLAIGARAARGERSARALLLGDRALPVWAVALSMIATELSAATFVGVPHAAFLGDWSYLQLAIGALAAKFWIARRVVPRYHAAGVVTVYGFLEQRFGPEAQRAAAWCFLGGRLLASGVRLFIAALAFSVVSGLSLEFSIVGCGAVAGVYTRAGGLRAVVWTDVLQGAVFVAAAALALFWIGSHVAGGWAGLFDWARAGERTTVFHTGPWISLSDGRALGSALAGGFFLTLATHTTDHDMVQRLLATRDGRGGGRALLASAWLNFPLTALFLAIGTGLAYFYTSPPPYDLGDGARVFPLFALHELPAGARGLVFAGLFAAAMSSLDSAICALSATWVSDLRGLDPDDATTPRQVRRASVAFAVLLIGAALAMAAYHRALPEPPQLGLVEVALSAMSLLYGGLLGVFGFGLLRARGGSASGAVLALVAGAVVGIALFLHPILLGTTVVAFVWWIPLSATTAVAVLALSGRGR